MRYGIELRVTNVAAFTYSDRISFSTIDFRKPLHNYLYSYLMKVVDFERVFFFFFFFQEVIRLKGVGRKVLFEACIRHTAKYRLQDLY